MTEEASVICDKRDRVYWITINRPGKRNALDDSVIKAIASGYDDAESDGAIRVIVLTGTGDRAFCAGADLDPGQNFKFDTSEPTLPYANLLRRAKRCRKPTIARVNGACMAGGMGLLCMTDLAVAADHAVFGLPEVKLGLFPMQVLALLKYLVAPRMLSEWCLTGARFDASQALQAGLVNYVVPAAELDQRIAILCDALASSSPAAIRRGKYVLEAMQAMSFEQAIAFAEGQISQMASSEDAREGLAAFAARRPPQWTGR
jgi:enoyl-CoA hydratase/carnithine racemase